MSRSCPRVTSPAPARSTLITSAPRYPRSCVQVGPDCTCVKSRIRTPSNALPITFPCSDASFDWCWSRPRCRSWLFLRSGIEACDAPALGAACLVDNRVDQRRPARLNRFLPRLAKLVGRLDVRAHTAERFHQLLVTRVFDEHQRRGIDPASRVLFVAAINTVVVHDHDAYRQVVAADRLGLHPRETE